jgi:hypothetical protein
MLRCFSSLAINDTPIRNEAAKLFTSSYDNFIQTTGIRDRLERRQRYQGQQAPAIADISFPNDWSEDNTTRSNKPQKHQATQQQMSAVSFPAHLQGAVRGNGGHRLPAHVNVAAFAGVP